MGKKSEPDSARLITEFIAWRKKQGFTRAYVEKLTKDRELYFIREGTLNQIESGRQDLKLSQAITMATLMGTSLDALVGLREFLPEQILLKFDSDHRVADLIENLLDEFGADQTIEMFYLCMEALAALLKKSKARITTERDPHRRRLNVAISQPPRRGLKKKGQNKKT